MRRGDPAHGGVNPALRWVAGRRLFLGRGVVFQRFGGRSGAGPCRLAPRARRRGLGEEFGKVEGGLGGGDTHRAVLSGHSGLGGGAGAKGGPDRALPARHAPRVRRAELGMRLLWGER